MIDRHGRTIDCLRISVTDRCNRVRLSADGWIRPCLFSNLRFSVRNLGAAAALTRAVAAKPSAGSACTDRFMHAIGG
jgi:cyclic pyranopterin phosphate synthase